ncbi:GNAT family N-acetyltransferase [Fictibacillus iocasae]|uniref:GNAT family N-acetyltransferase n=1 Tax=Fictibacillus iocasae TaxID=2715437 RepID=A0ABW2NQ99_9BACL
MAVDVFTVKIMDSSEEALTEIARCYGRVWGGGEDVFLERLKRHRTYEGFLGIAAYTNEKQLAGFAYGYTSEKGQYYRTLLELALTQEQSEYWLKDCFEFVELAVENSYRGMGIGKELAESLLNRAEQKTAVLTTQSDNVSAVHLYDNLNWTTLHEHFLPTADSSLPYVIMGKVLS